MGALAVNDAVVRALQTLHGNGLAVEIDVSITDSGIGSVRDENGITGRSGSDRGL